MSLAMLLVAREVASFGRRRTRSRRRRRHRTFSKSYPNHSSDTRIDDDMSTAAIVKGKNSSSSRGTTVVTAD